MATNHLCSAVLSHATQFDARWPLKGIIAHYWQAPTICWVGGHQPVYLQGTFLMVARWSAAVVVLLRKTVWHTAACMAGIY
jgi:hypothetical protein